MDEDLPVVPGDDGVAQHPHVGLQRQGAALAVPRLEAQVVSRSAFRGSWCQSRVPPPSSMPPSARGACAQPAARRRARSRPGPAPGRPWTSAAAAGTVTVSTRVCGKPLSWTTSRVEPVGAGRQRGQRGLERPAARGHRVEVGEGVEPRLAQQEEVHELAVVRHQRGPVRRCARRRSASDSTGRPPSRRTAEATWNGLKIPAVARPSQRPTRSCRPRGRGRRGRAADRGRDAGPVAAPGVRRLAGRRATLSRTAAPTIETAPANRNSPRPASTAPSPVLHLQHPRRHGGHRHQRLPLARRPLHLHPHAVGGADHQPELAAPGARRARAPAPRRPAAAPP